MPRSEPPERPTDQSALPTRCSSTAWNSESRCVTRPGARTRQSSASHIGSCAKPEPGRGRQHPRAPAMQPAPAPVPSGSTHLRSRLRPALTPVESTRTTRFPIDRPRARLSARCSLLGSTSTGRASTWPVAPGLGGHLRNERRAPKRYRSPALAQTRPLALRAVGEPRVAASKPARSSSPAGQSRGAGSAQTPRQTVGPAATAEEAESAARCDGVRFCLTRRLFLIGAARAATSDSRVWWLWALLCACLQRVGWPS